MQLTESPEWTALLPVEGPLPLPQLNQLAATIDSARLDELTALLETGSDRERRLAVSVVAAVSFAFRNEPQRFAAADRGRLADALVASATPNYPQRPTGLQAMHALRFLDGSRAAEHLRIVEPQPDWSSMSVDAFLNDMQFTLPDWVERFQEFARHDGELGTRALSRLESAGHISRARLDSLGEEFRRQRDVRTLNKLYTVFVAHQANKPIDPVITLLGEPSKRLTGAYIYEAEGVQLYLEQDGEGRLTGMKLK